jgi:hypothetical protein
MTHTTVFFSLSFIFQAVFKLRNSIIFYTFFFSYKVFSKLASLSIFSASFVTMESSFPKFLILFLLLLFKYFVKASAPNTPSNPTPSAASLIAITGQIQHEPIVTAPLAPKIPFVYTAIAPTKTPASSPPAIYAPE